MNPSHFLLIINRPAIISRAMSRHYQDNTGGK